MTRKRWKKKMVALAIVVGIILALLLARCTGAFGWGGGATDDDDDGNATTTETAASATADASMPCAVRVDAAGITVAGKSVEVADIARACAASRATLTITGDARHGDAEAVRAALTAASIDVLERAR